jgi:ATP-dependent DNA ligase
MDAPLMTFQDVQGVVLSGQPSFLKDEIKLYVFAIGGAFKNTQAMIEKMHSVFSGCAHIVPVDYRLISKADIDIHYKEALAHGFEGLMLRQPYGHYDQGGLFRLKPVKEADFIITGYYEGRGANVGRLGGFVCEGEVDGKPIRVRVGGGFKVEEREEFWAMGTQCIGLTLEVIYKYVTDKPDKDGFYSLREPRANKMKLDR